MTEQIVLNALNLVDAADKEAFWAKVETVYQSGEHESAYTLIRNEPAIQALMELVGSQMVSEMTTCVYQGIEGDKSRFSSEQVSNRLTRLLDAVLMDDRVDAIIFPILQKWTKSDFINELITPSRELFEKLTIIQEHRLNPVFKPLVKEAFDLVLDSSNYQMWRDVQVHLDKGETKQAYAMIQAQPQSKKLLLAYNEERTEVADYIVGRLLYGQNQRFIHDPTKFNMRYPVWLKALGLEKIDSSIKKHP